MNESVRLFTSLSGITLDVYPRDPATSADSQDARTNSPVIRVKFRN